jgi:hypothetical protein
MDRGGGAGAHLDLPNQPELPCSIMTPALGYDFFTISPPSTQRMPRIETHGVTRTLCVMGDQDRQKRPVC